MGNVSSDTIFNCWVKTGILPSTSDNDITNVMQIQQDILDNEVADTNQFIEDLVQHLTNLLLLPWQML